ncbi:MAG: N-acetylmuramoyl-L-alanine amidase [Bacteroidales bacterium]
MLKFLPVIFYHSKRISLLILALNALFLSSPAQSNNEKPYRLRRVVIDPGHGGKDPGAIGRNGREKDIVLAISLKLGGYINQYLPDVEVLYTRDSDEFIELHRRAEIANRNHADLFISVHANANTNKNVRGTDTFVMGLHTSKENLEVARKENEVILIEDDYDDQYEGFDPNSPESYIIFSLMQNTFLNQSLDFASYVQNQFRERASRIDRGVRQAGFLVLWQTTMPSVLIEVGFISNEQEERFLLSDQGQSYIASAIFRAFRDYKTSLERKSDALYASSVNMHEGASYRDSPGEESGDDNIDTGRPATEESLGQPDDVIFKVQVGSSRNQIPLDSDFFNGLEDIEVFEADGLFKYVVGNSASLEDIVAFRRVISDIFPDAFIVAVRRGNLISLQEAINTD